MYFCVGLAFMDGAPCYFLIFFSLHQYHCTALAGQLKYWIGRKSTADAILLLVTNIICPLDKTIIHTTPFLSPY